MKTLLFILLALVAITTALPHPSGPFSDDSNSELDRAKRSIQLLDARDLVEGSELLNNDRAKRQLAVTFGIGGQPYYGGSSPYYGGGGNPYNNYYGGVSGPSGGRPYRPYYNNNPYNNNNYYGGGAPPSGSTGVRPPLSLSLGK